MKNSKKHLFFNFLQKLFLENNQNLQRKKSKVSVSFCPFSLYIYLL